tara:strand:- start:5257 stop:5982 length:726 start_codon:yes stop_codon:yes gene_type:complete
MEYTLKLDNGGKVVIYDCANADIGYKKETKTRLPQGSWLTEVEKIILFDRLLKGGRKRRTLRSIANKTRVSHERVRQLEEAVIAKVRDAVLTNSLHTLAVDPMTFINTSKLQVLANKETGLALQLNSFVGSPMILIDEHWKLLFQPLSVIRGTVRFNSGLDNAKIETVLDLCTRTEAELLKVKNFGMKSLKEVKEMLAELGLGLGSRLCWAKDGRCERPLYYSEEKAFRKYIREAQDSLDE